MNRNNIRNKNDGQQEGSDSTPRFFKPLNVYLDASNYPFGAAVVQYRKLLGVHTRKLSHFQLNYTVFEE